MPPCWKMARSDRYENGDAPEGRAKSSRRLWHGKVVGDYWTTMSCGGSGLASESVSVGMTSTI